ncbi:MAG: flagellar brake protein [Syntrophobacteraceae bacterium]
MREIPEKTETEDEKDDFYVIPLRLGADIVLKAAVNPSLKTKSTVYGAVPGQMIMVEEPQFVLNERFTFICQEFECVYLHNVYLYKFRSDFIKEIIPSVIGIGYPVAVERVQIRAYARMPVAIETEVFLGAKEGTVTALMEDLSVGGCRLQLPRLVQVQKGANFQLSFIMPDNTIVKNLICVVRNIKVLHGKKATVIGACFAEGSPVVNKIEQFCRLFAVEQI